MAEIRSEVSDTITLAEYRRNREAEDLRRAKKADKDGSSKTTRVNPNTKR